MGQNETLQNRSLFRPVSLLPDVAHSGKTSQNDAGRHGAKWNPEPSCLRVPLLRHPDDGQRHRHDVHVILKDRAS